MKKYLDKLKKNNLKITSKRVAILELLERSGEALSPEDIRNELAAKFEKVSYPSVYKNLEDMSRIGVLAKIARPDRRLYYALCRAREDKHHHHIICSKCGKVGEVEECDLFRRKVINGYRITSHFLQLEGICSDCGK
ncbi:MAG: transcriptional repressor [Candidatus Omnitrophica bacterium]|nr:transcriptional repressor [Candidatus Omnitrophota bacterium]